MSSRVCSCSFLANGEVFINIGSAYLPWMSSVGSQTYLFLSSHQRPCLLLSVRMETLPSSKYLLLNVFLPVSSEEIDIFVSSVLVSLLVFSLGDFTLRSLLFCWLFLCPAMSQRRHSVCGGLLTAFRRPCALDQWEVRGSPASGKSVGAGFPTACAPHVALCHILVVLTFFQTLSLFVMICDQWLRFVKSSDDGELFSLHLRHNSVDHLLFSSSLVNVTFMSIRKSRVLWFTFDTRCWDGPEPSPPYFWGVSILNFARSDLCLPLLLYLTHRGRW